MVVSDQQELGLNRNIKNTADEDHSKHSSAPTGPFPVTDDDDRLQEVANFDSLASSEADILWFERVGSYWPITTTRLSPLLA